MLHFPWSEREFLAALLLAGGTIYLAIYLPIREKIDSV
jgi:hypothetical protein